jgi:ribose transport system ATP-binding protein
MVHQEKIVLECRDIEKSFDATSVLKKARLSVGTGEIHALLGGNGAGKSTLIRIISGSTQANAGTVQVNGSSQFEPGSIAVVFQELALFPHLTVAENIDLPNRDRAFGLAGGRRPFENAHAVLSLIDETLAQRAPDTLVGDLDLHERQLVEIARALASGARIILLDEPTANLTFGESERLFAIMRRLAGNGISLVIVSHRMSEIRAVADVCTVLRDGRTVIDRVPLAEISDEDIVEAMGQGQLAALAQAPEVGSRHMFGEAKHDPAKCLRIAHGDMAIMVKPGDVLGLAGAPDGPSDLIDGLIGAKPSRNWQIERNGKPIAFGSPAQAVRAGVGYVSGDRAGKGILPALPILDNLVAASRIARRRWVTSASEMTAAGRALRRLSIKASSVDALPQTLSGGTQQKLLLARWLDHVPDILVLEEPTRGVDIGTKREIYAIVRAAAGTGAIVVWWSTEFSELVAVCTSVISFDVAGLPAGIVEGAGITEVALARSTGMAA